MSYREKCHFFLSCLLCRHYQSILRSLSLYRTTLVSLLLGPILWNCLVSAVDYYKLHGLQNYLLLLLPASILCTQDFLFIFLVPEKNYCACFASHLASYLCTFWELVLNEEKVLVIVFLYVNGMYRI